ARPFAIRRRDRACLPPKPANATVTMPSGVLAGGLLGRLLIGEKDLSLLPQRVHDLRLRHLAHDLALPEDQADPPATGHADVRAAGLPGAVDLAVVQGGP